MVGLGDLPGGGIYSWAHGTSGDGSLVVGRGAIVDGARAFIWDQINGVRQLDIVISSTGVDLTGWTLTQATAISDDGNTIVGYGTNPDGDEEGWVFMLNAPPPPSEEVPGLGPASLGIVTSLLGCAAAARLRTGNTPYLWAVE